MPLKSLQTSTQIANITKINKTGIVHPADADAIMKSQVCEHVLYGVIHCCVCSCCQFADEWCWLLISRFAWLLSWLHAAIAEAAQSAALVQRRRLSGFSSTSNCLTVLYTVLCVLECCHMPYACTSARYWAGPAEFHIKSHKVCAGSMAASLKHAICTDGLMPQALLGPVCSSWYIKHVNGMAVLGISSKL